MHQINFKIYVSVSQYQKFILLPFYVKINNFTPILIEINIPDSTYNVNMTTITLSRWRRVFRDNLPNCSFGNINIFKSTHCLFLSTKHLFKNCVTKYFIGKIKTIYYSFIKNNDLFYFLVLK